MPVCLEAALDLPRATSVVLSAERAEVPASLNLLPDVWGADSVTIQQTIISGRVAVTLWLRNQSKPVCGATRQYTMKLLWRFWKVRWVDEMV